MKPAECRVLIADDEPDLRNALAFDFKRKGFQVHTVNSGKEALAFVLANTVDVVITDVRMPDGDGIELLTELKKRDLNRPAVILVTGFAEIGLEEAYDIGADAVFPKPFDRKALHETVLRAIEPSALRFNRPSRVPAEIAVTIRSSKGESPYQGKVSNIGRGGMFCAMTEPFPPEQDTVAFDLSCSLQEIGQIKGEGVVRWVRTPGTVENPSGCGIEFTFLEANCRGAVVELLNYLKTKHFIPRR